jgi:hypothetical protein
MSFGGGNYNAYGLRRAGISTVDEEIVFAGQEAISGTKISINFGETPAFPHFRRHLPRPPSILHHGKINAIPCGMGLE